MGLGNFNGLVNADESPDQQLRRLVAQYSQPKPAPPAGTAGTPAPVNPTPIAAPDSQPAPIGPTIGTPPTQIPRQAGDEAELQRLQSTGSGVSQLQHKHPIIGTIARVGDVALGSMFPRIAALTPGTTTHHDVLVNNAENQVSNDVSQGAKQAQTAQVAGETSEIPSIIAKNQAEADNLNNKPAPTGEDVQHQYADAVAAAIKAGRDPNSDPIVKQLQDTITGLQKQPTGAKSIDEQYNEAIAAGDSDTATRLLKVKSDLAKAGQPFGQQRLDISLQNQQEKNNNNAATANSTVHAFTRYQQSFHDLSPQLTNNDRKALEILTSHQQLAEGFLTKAASGVLDALFGEPVTGYSEKAMGGIMTKDQFDKMSPAGKKMATDYFNAVIQNFANMKQLMGSVGRNPMQLQAEINTIPLPYIDDQSAEQMFQDKMEDLNLRNKNMQGYEPAQSAPASSSGRRVVDLTK